MAISSEISAQGTTRRGDRHRGTAFLVEALVVLGFLMVALAVFVQLFGKAQLLGVNANQLSEAVMMASSYAEEFSADPTGVTEHIEGNNGLTATCDVQTTAHNAGTLYEATIEVSDGSKTVYTLHTARYVGQAERSAR